MREKAKKMKKEGQKMKRTPAKERNKVKGDENEKPQMKKVTDKWRKQEENRKEELTPSKNQKTRKDFHKQIPIRLLTGCSVGTDINYLLELNL